MDGQPDKRDGRELIHRHRDRSNAYCDEHQRRHRHLHRYPDGERLSGSCAYFNCYCKSAAIRNSDSFIAGTLFRCYYHRYAFQQRERNYLRLDRYAEWRQWRLGRNRHCHRANPYCYRRFAGNSHLYNHAYGEWLFRYPDSCHSYCQPYSICNCNTFFRLDLFGWCNQRCTDKQRKRHNF